MRTKIIFAASIVVWAGSLAHALDVPAVYLTPRGSETLVDLDQIHGRDIMMVTDAQRLDDLMHVEHFVEVLYLHPDGLDELDPGFLRGYFENGKVIVGLNTPLSELAGRVGLSIRMEDLKTHLHSKMSKISSMTLLMALFSDDGRVDGYYAFSDFVVGLPGVERVVAAVLGAFTETETGQLLQKAECVYGSAQSKSVNLVGNSWRYAWSQTACKPDPYNGGNGYFAQAYTSGVNVDKVMLDTTTWNNCSYWHQISTSYREHANFASFPEPGVLAGTPSCGNKWYSQSWHGAKIGYATYWTSTQSCAGSGC